ncbi:hypothetical protein CCR75_002257 [Bremia lactucae]|uniref:Uncharacterized protein n=1 Tax=Bremia lactucae TaxID=4779 RepID=A0A976FMM1_BRELC|nr:hypothetical protein CCR75_002257 [Bremia lactucae]
MRRQRKRKQAQIEEVDAEWDADASTNFFDDTMSSIQLLLNRNADAFAAQGLPPILLWHQLYTILPNRTFIDQNVHRLRSIGKLITLKVSTGSEDRAIIRVEDYLAKVKTYEDVFREQIRQHPMNSSLSVKLKAMAAYRQALPKLASLSTVPMDVFISIMNEGVDGANLLQTHSLIGQIQRLGFLLPTTRLDAIVFSFSVPGMGKLVSAVSKSRALIQRTLKRTKYKEMHELQLKKLRLKSSPFNIEFHLVDMEGCGLIRRTKVTGNVLVALADN